MNVEYLRGAVAGLESAIGTLQARKTEIRDRALEIAANKSRYSLQEQAGVIGELLRLNVEGDVILDFINGLKKTSGTIQEVIRLHEELM